MKVVRPWRPAYTSNSGATPTRQRWQTGLGDLGLACLSGVLLVLSFPKFDLQALAWISLVPLLVALEGKGLKGAALLSYVTGLVFFNGIGYWLLFVDGYNWLDHALLPGVYLPQYVTLWGLGLTWVCRRTGLPTALVAPPLWVALEYLRTHLAFLSLPWMLLGHSQYLQPALTQITSMTGVYGLSFLIMLINAALAEALWAVRQRRSPSTSAAPVQRFPICSLTVAGLLLLATVLYGVVVLSRGSTGERLTVALVQGNISQKRKWDGAHRQGILARYADLTRQAAQRAPALILWPETAVPGDVQHYPELKRQVERLAIEAKAPLLVGSAEYAKFTNRELRGKYYNSMVFFSPTGQIVEEYRKIALVPFGEYIPLRDVVKWPEWLASSMGNMLPGDRYTLFSVGDVSFGAVICWETIFPDLFRAFVKQGARFMVNATNEAWFDVTAAPYQFLAMSTFRAVENRVAIARVANTGISALIDPFGRITERLRGPEQQDLFVEGVLVGDILLSQEKTFYTQHGDVFAFLHIAVSALMLLFGCKRLVAGQTKGDAQKGA